ncbi:MAG: glycerophosphodiester phosphodiesterase family protein [Sinimarinibacterium flocculans]|uniref:glycerophosphodiester phosphodiesterase family protein n=1 Tax=Sinimarinibacterium flocculans TaxID=985250 RepID=UPI003C4ED453
MSMSRGALLGAALMLSACGDGGSGTALSEATLHVFDAAAPEGSAGEPGVLRFDVVRSGTADGPAEVAWSTRDLDALAGQHYVAQSGTLAFAAGQRVRSIGITLIGDDADAPARRFAVDLHDARGAAVADGSAQGIIANDDMPCLLPPADNPWLERRPIGFAHRGGVREFPENTLYAYRESARLGADVLEMDVYATADGELVVLHDTTVDRTTNGSGTVESMTLAELQALDAAYWFVPGQGTPHDAADSAYAFRGIATGERAPPPGYRAEDFRIPTLEEALRAFPDHLLNVELKPSVSGTGSYEAQVATLLLRYGRATDVMVASFLDHTATLFKLSAPCVSTSVPTVQVAALLLTSSGPLPMLPLAIHQAFQVPRSTASIGQIPEPIELTVLSEDFVDDAHAAGLAVHAWTIDDCDEMVELLQMGVDGIMSDRPARMIEVLQQPENEWSCDDVE